MRLAWYNFCFTLPEDWEVTRYSTAAPSGRFEFNNREGSLGRLSWETTKKFPDRERILTEYHRRYLQKAGEEQLEGFEGIKTTQVVPSMVGSRHEGEPCQAVAHLPDQNVVLLWVFPSYSSTRMAAVWKPILKSFVANTGAWREWACFGLRGRLPEAFEVERAACLPADAWIEFQHKNMHRVDLHRWGMPRELLRGRDLEQFARDILKGSDARVLETQRERWRGMDSVLAKIETRGTRGMDRLFSSYWRGEARFWHDEREKRLYACVQAAPHKVAHLTDTELLPL